MGTCASCTNARPDAAQIHRSNALLCHFCLWAEHDGGMWSGTAVTCTVSGKPVELHIASCKPSCPKNKHWKDGIVRFAWMRWMGHVYPLAWLMRRQFTGPLPACGCMVWAKMLWLKIRHKLARTNKGTSHGSVQPQH